MPRLGSAIASTILSYAALSLVGVDKAQAAVLTYNFDVGGGGGDLKDFLKVDTSLLTGIGQEYIAVSEGRFYGYNLAGRIQFGRGALFTQGHFSGLQTSGGEDVITELIIPPGEPFGPLYIKWDRRISWFIDTYPAPIS